MSVSTLLFVFFDSNRERPFPNLLDVLNGFDKEEALLLFEDFSLTLFLLVLQRIFFMMYDSLVYVFLYPISVKIFYFTFASRLFEEAQSGDCKCILQIKAHNLISVKNGSGRKMRTEKKNQKRKFTVRTKRHEPPNCELE